MHFLALKEYTVLFSDSRGHWMQNGETLAKQTVNLYVKSIFDFNDN